jgi:hypothetical protein
VKEFIHGLETPLAFTRHLDAFATGQALYSLALSGHMANDSVVRRACDFLLRTQDNDGSWQTPQESINTRHRVLNI